MSQSFTVMPDTDAASSEEKCPHCEKEFKHKAALTWHLKVHNEVLESRCDAKFTRKDNLSQHQQRVHKIVNLNVDILKKTTKDFVCKMCGQKFGKDRLKFEVHLLHKACRNEEESIEVNDDERYQCDQCDKTYAEKNSLNRHCEWKHRGKARDLKCQVCEASYQHKSSLLRHVKKNHPKCS